MSKQPPPPSDGGRAMAVPSASVGGGGDQDADAETASTTSPEELARRSGFAPAHATNRPTSTSTSTPGAYHVRPVPLSSSWASDDGGTAAGISSGGGSPRLLSMPADSVDGDYMHNNAPTQRRRRTGENHHVHGAGSSSNNPGSATVRSDCCYSGRSSSSSSSDVGGGVEYVAVAHLVEDAVCEPAVSPPAAEAADTVSADSESGVSGGGIPARNRGPPSSEQGSAGTCPAGAATAAAGGDGDANGDGTNTNGVHHGAGDNLSSDVVIAEKLDSRSISICGKHGRWQRWHCLVLGGLLLAACVAIPTAVVLGGVGTGSKRGHDNGNGIGDIGDDGSGNGDGGGSGGGSPLNWTQPGLLESIVVPSVSDPSTLENANSPQSRALRWLGEGGGAAVVTGPDVSGAEWRIRQRYALAVLYYSTGGNRWKEQYGFLNATTAHECGWGSEMLNNGWTALECNDGMEVTLINLWQNNLAGPLPGELKALSSLTALDFLTNKLTGTLPVDIAALASLNYLNLGYNQFSGTVPSELGDLDQITYLMMDWNDLTGTIPSELGRLVQLSGWLSLEGNDLHGTVPPSFANFTQATWIYLNNNDLTGSAEFLCDALQPVEGPGYTNDNSTSPLLELWVDVDEVNCICCNCCPFPDR